jgi:trigger factor
MEFEHKIKKDKKTGVATLTVTVPYEEFIGYNNRAVDVYSREGEVPGFRKGKAPRPRVISHFGQKTVQDFALRFMACEVTLEAIEKEGVGASGKVHFTLPIIEKDKPIEFTATFTLGEGTEVEPELPWPRVGDEGLEDDDKPYGLAPDYIRKPRK